MLNLRKGLALMLVAVMAVAAGCAGAAQPKAGDKGTGTAPATPKEKVKITFWHGMTKEHGDALKAAVKSFNESQNEVVVEETYQGSYGDLDKKMLGALQSNTAPTVTQLTDSMLTAYVASKAVIELDSLVPATEKADYAKGLLEAATFDGKLYALPFNKSMIVQIYDNKLVPKAPTTWEEFEATTKDLLAKTGKPGTALEANVYDFGTLLAQAGGEWLKNGKAAFNSEAGVKSLTYLQNLMKSGAAVQLKPKEYKSNYFNEGRTPVTFTTSASFAFIQKEGWKTAPLFKGPAGHAVPLSGANVAILKGANAAQQKAAAKFLLHLTGKEGTLIFTTRKTGYMPVRKSAIGDQRWKDFVKANPEYEALGASVEYGVTQPNIANWSKIQKEITTAVEKVFLGQAEPKAALDEAAAKANEILGKK
jgi:multiple sugar transport system substrate-binding protein